MSRKLLSYLLLTLSSQAFDKAELLFEKQDYLGAVTAFLKNTQLNDARVFPFLQHCQDNNLIDPNALDDNTKQAWFDRLDHAQFAPTGYPGGNIFLQLSLLARNIKANDQQIMSLSRTYQTGYGFYILARAQEQESDNKPSNSAVKKIISTYQQGASYADPYSLLALSRLSSQAKNHKIKIEKRHTDEIAFLQQYSISSQHSETGTPELTLSRLYSVGRTVEIRGSNQQLRFPADGKRTSLWQFVAAQKGNTDIQIMCSVHANTFQRDYPSIPAPDTPQGLRWSYLAALSGSFYGQNELAEAFHPNNKSAFSADGKRCVYWLSKALESFKSLDSTDPNYAHYKNNHTRCLINLGFLYDKGLAGIEVDEAKALDYYRQAADLYENPIALHNVASMMENGQGTSKDTLAAKKYFERASKAGSTESSLLLGKRYLEGADEHFPQNQVLAYGYLQRCKTLPEAKYLFAGLLAHLYPQNITFIIQKDETTAEQLLKESVKDGYYNAQEFWIKHKFGNRYSMSQEDQLLLVTLVQTLHSLDSNNFSEALCILMIENYQGKFDNHDQQIRDLLLELESKESKTAYLNIAYAHETGKYGFEQSFGKAIDYYRKDPNSPESLCNLGFCLERTQGRAAIDEILDLYTRSFELGSATAGNNLGALYQNGRFIAKDDGLARHYYKEAALRGDSDATLQYIQYVLSEPANDETLNEAKDLAFNLDQNDPFSLYIISMLYFQLGDSGKALNSLAEAAFAGIPQAMYSLGMYIYTLSCSIPDQAQKREMREEAITFIRSAAEKNFDFATSALRILERTNRLDDATTTRISTSLLAWNREEARRTLAEARQQQTAQSEASSSAPPREENNDRERARRIEAELESFLDPNNHITMNDFQRIVSHLGGSITNGRGSALRADLNGQTTGVHRMHRPGQSSNVELEPGRASSLRDFIRRATDNS